MCTRGTDVPPILSSTMARFIAVLKYVAYFLLFFVLFWTHFGFAHRRQAPVDWETALRIVLPDAIFSSLLCVLVMLMLAAFDDKKEKNDDR